MSMSAANKDKVQAITSKDIRKFNDEFLMSKGIKLPEPANKEGGAVNTQNQPRKAPGAPSPDPVKKKKNKKKKGDKKTGMPTY